eukprot:232021_1
MELGFVWPLGYKRVNTCGYMWSSTAPFCEGQCGSGWEFLRKDAYGDGAYCMTGWKHLCKGCTSNQREHPIVEDVSSSAAIWRCSDFFPRVCGAGFGDFGINAIVLMSHDEENEEVDLTVSMDLCEDFGDTGIEFILGGDAEVCTEELGFDQNADLKFDIFKGSLPLDVSQFDCTTKADDGDYCDIGHQRVPHVFMLIIISY